MEGELPFKKLCVGYDTDVDEDAVYWECFSRSRIGMEEVYRR